MILKTRWHPGIRLGDGNHQQRQIDAWYFAISSHASMMSRFLGIVLIAILNVKLSYVFQDTAG
jgi:hypothetical protein